MCQSVFSSVLSFVRSCGSEARVGVVGSRDYPSPFLVRLFVSGLPSGSVVVSGGGGAVDEAAAAAAVEFGLELWEYPDCWLASGAVSGRRLVGSGLCCLVVFVSSLVEVSEEAALAVRLALEAGVPVFFFGWGGGLPPASEDEE